jgi:hypothetical protein
MELYARCLNGFKLANNSFSLAWKYKQLFIYSALTTLLTLGIIAMVLIMQGQFEIGNLLSIFQIGAAGVRYLTSSIIIHFVLMASIFFVDALLTVSLIYHFMKLIRNQQTTIRENISASLAKIGIITLFAIASAVVWLCWMYLIPVANPEMPHARGDVALWLVISTILLAWNMVIVLALPIITLENISYPDALKNSITLIVHHLPEFIVGGIWMLIVYIALGILFDAPVILAAKFLSPTMATNGALPALALLLTGIVTMYIQSAIAIYCTLIYQAYKE